LVRLLSSTLTHYDEEGGNTGHDLIQHAI